MEYMSAAELLQHKDSLQRLLEMSCTKLLDFGLKWPRSALRLPLLAKECRECRNCDGMVIKAWGETNICNHLQNYLHPITKKKAMKTLQLHCQES